MSPSFARFSWRKALWAPWPPAWEDPSSSYGAPFAMRFLPTWSTWWEEPILQTNDEGNGRGRADNGGAVWFGRFLAMVRTASGGALALRSRSTASPCSPQAPPCVNCFGRRWIELMRWLSSCTRVWGLQDKIRWVRATIYRASWSYS
jgi:hypothetical protein